MIIGHEGVATAITKLLIDHGADAARTVEQLHGFPEGTIRTPGEDDIHPVFVDAVSKGRYPTWMVAPADTPIRRTGSYGGSTGTYDETNWRYPFSIATYVADEHEAATQLQRFRLMMVLRVLLIQTKLLVKTELSKAEIDISEMQEIVGRSGAPTEADPRYLAEGITAFHVTTIEAVPAPQKPYGVVSQIDQLTSKLDRP